MSDKPEQQKIDNTSAPLLDHLIELRERLIKGLIGLTIAFIGCFIFSSEIFDLMAQPYLWVADLQQGDELIAAGAEAIPPAQQFITTVTYEFFSVKLRIALYAGLFLSFPVIALQIYRFIAPGLYNNEKQAFLPFLIATPFLFIFGGVLLYFVMLPAILYFFQTLEAYNASGLITIQHTPKVSEYVDFVLKMMIGTGIAFQLPVVLTLLGKVGLITSEWLAASRRFAVVIMLVGAAFLTPADPYSMFVLFVPLYGFYELSILIIRIFERGRGSKSSSELEKQDAEA